VEEIERSAASVEEAIEAALQELGVSEQEASIQIVQEPRSGILGIASQPAVVRVRVATRSATSGGRDDDESLEEDDQPSSALDEHDDLPDQEERDDQADAAADFVQGLMDAMGLDADVEIQTVDRITYVDVWAATEGEDMGLLIGKHGHTLDALQELVRSHVNSRVGGRCLVQIDVEDYRKRRRSRLISRAREVANRVKRSGRAEALEPMSAFERKIVHDTVAELDGLETISEGEEPSRRVVVRRSSSR
jgi:spoIIIJ-associated protein